MIRLAFIFSACAQIAFASLGELIWSTAPADGAYWPIVAGEALVLSNLNALALVHDGVTERIGATSARVKTPDTFQDGSIHFTGKKLISRRDYWKLLDRVKAVFNQGSLFSGANPPADIPVYGFCSCADVHSHNDASKAYTFGRSLNNLDIGGMVHKKGDNGIVGNDSSFFDFMKSAFEIGGSWRANPWDGDWLEAFRPDYCAIVTNEHNSPVIAFQPVRNAIESLGKVDMMILYDEPDNDISHDGVDDNYFEHEVREIKKSRNYYATIDFTPGENETFFITDYAVNDEYEICNTNPAKRLVAKVDQSLTYENAEVYVELYSLYDVAHHGGMDYETWLANCPTVAEIKSDYVFLREEEDELGNKSKYYRAAWLGANSEWQGGTIDFNCDIVNEINLTKTIRAPRPAMNRDNIYQTLPPKVWGELMPGWEQWAPGISAYIHVTGSSSRTDGDTIIRSNNFHATIDSGVGGDVYSTLVGAFNDYCSLPEAEELIDITPSVEVRAEDLVVKPPLYAPVYAFWDEAADDFHVTPSGIAFKGKFSSDAQEEEWDIEGTSAKIACVPMFVVRPAPTNIVDNIEATIKGRVQKIYWSFRAITR